MVCPTCGGRSFTTVTDFRWWCHGCGRVLSGVPGHDDLVPATVKGYAALWASAGKARAYVRHTLEFFEWSAFPHLRESAEQLAARLDAALAAAPESTEEASR